MLNFFNTFFDHDHDRRVCKSNCDQPYILPQPQLDFLSPPEKIWFVQFFVLYLYSQMQLDLVTLTGTLILGHKKTPRFHEGFSN